MEDNCDTDSNFLYNRPFTNTLRQFFPEKLSGYEEILEKKMGCINISMFTFTKLITVAYDHMGKTLNVDDAHRPIINMKNEFTYSRLMCTPAKKHYAGMLMAQEGIILKGDPERRLDMKGISLRKSSLNKKIRKYFEGTLINKILLPENINLAEVYKDFNSISEEIVISLLNGDTEFAYPGKVNSMVNYAAPYTIQTLRGTLLWNAIFPDRAINMPDKVNYIKLKPTPYTEFIEKIPEEYRKSVIDLYSKHIGKNGEKGLKDYDVSIICFPKSVKRIPSFLIPLIDKQTVVHDLLKAGIEIVEPLGFKKLDITTNSYTTNIINL